MPTIKGTSAAVAPIVVPTIKRVVNASKESKMINGMDRTILITLSKSSKHKRFSINPLGRVTTKTTLI